MRAAPGAIERIEIDDKTFEPALKIIGEDDWNTGKAKGICGSAIIDAVAEFSELDFGCKRKISTLPEIQTPRLRQGENGLEYVIAYAEETSIGQDISITQKDFVKSNWQRLHCSSPQELC